MGSLENGVVKDTSTVVELGENAKLTDGFNGAGLTEEDLAPTILIRLFYLTLFPVIADLTRT